MPATSPEPGPFNSFRTRYTIKVSSAFTDPRYNRVVLVMGTQQGKSVTIENICGSIQDDDPSPCLYVAPTRQMITAVIEPKIMAMINESASLRQKLVKGKSTQTRKVFTGGSLRFAWGGSPSELAAESARYVVVDEVDRLTDTAEGDTTEIVEARGDAYPDSTVGYVATPTRGRVTRFIHPRTGLEHWAKANDEVLGSTIWRLWQSGTRHEWAVCCPHCKEYFIPWSGLLSWQGREDPDTETRVAVQTAFLLCPNNGCVIEDRHRQAMNDTGVEVAPGQTIEEALRGDLTHADTAGEMTFSLVVSGLFSFSVKKSFGFLAGKLARARQTGDPKTLQAVYNTGFGEVYAEGGQVAKWQDVHAHRVNYRKGEDLDKILRVTLSVDVQKDRLVYVVRGWRAGMSSALLDCGNIWGDTDAKVLEPGTMDVWDQLDDLACRQFSGRVPDVVGVDAGYRQHRTLDFVRRNRRRYVALKGKSPMQSFFSLTLLDVGRSGKAQKRGDSLLLINVDRAKEWVHSRIGWDPKRFGAWLLPSDIEENYCHEIVAEEMDPATGKWRAIARDNHFLDCEAMAYALAKKLGMHKVRGRSQDRLPEDPESAVDVVDGAADESGAAAAPAAKDAAAVKPRRRRVKEPRRKVVRGPKW